MTYDYKEAMKSDIRDWMEENTDYSHLDKAEQEEMLYDVMWVSDSITGNASGSYTFNRFEARENFFNDCDSEDYLDQMVDEGFISREDIGKQICASNWEIIDVWIRCLLLAEVLHDVLFEKEV